MTTFTPAPKSKSRTDAERFAHRKAQLQKLERSRRQPIARGSSPARSGKAPRRNPKRKASEFARAYGSRARVQFVKQYACLVGDAYCVGEPIENAHTASGGMSRKANADTIVPLCRYHHRELHRHGTATFKAVHRIDFATAAARVERDWQKYSGGAA